MNKELLKLIIIPVISFLGLFFITQLVIMILPNNSDEYIYYSLLVIGSVVVCCTYLIIDKINDTHN